MRLPGKSTDSQHPLDLGASPGLGSKAFMVLIGLALLALLLGGVGKGKSIAMLAIGAAILALALKRSGVITRQINQL